jgi:hypothetical protein
LTDRAKTLREYFQWKRDRLAAIRDEVELLTEAQLGFRVESGQWSISEILEHLVIVEKGIVRMLDVYLKKAEPLSAESLSGGTREVRLPDVVHRPEYRKIKTRANLEPTGTVRAQESLSVLFDLQHRIDALEIRYDAIDAGSVSVEHPIFGPLSLDQWIAFLGFHEERHANQIKMILETLDSSMRAKS